MSGWIAFLTGKNPGYPLEALRGELAAVREKVQGMRRDPTTPDTRLADDPMKYNPAAARALVELTLGGFHTPVTRGRPSTRACATSTRLTAGPAFRGTSPRWWTP